MMQYQQGDTRGWKEVCKCERESQRPEMCTKPVLMATSGWDLQINASSSPFGDVYLFYANCVLSV